MSRQQEPLGCLFAVLKMFGLGPPDEPDRQEYPFQLRDYLLTKSERLFFVALQKAIANRFLIFAKVRLADLVSVPRGTEKWQTHFNRIQSKHIDFVICDHEQVRPLVAIELDDSSHNRADRQDRDAFVDSALSAAGLPILHVIARAKYDVQDLADLIQKKMREQ